MLVGIISDSHDHHENVLKAVSIFNEKGVEYVFHAGDIVSPFTAKAFAKLKTAKFISVFGNNAGEKLFLKKTIENFGGQIFEYNYKTTLNNKKIIMTHTPHFLDDMIESQKHDLIIYGHTHIRDIRNVGKSLIINPGESTDWLTNDPTIVILDFDTFNTEIISLK